MKVNLLQLAFGYVNAALNTNTRNTDPDIGTVVSSLTRPNMRVEGSGSRFAQLIQGGFSISPGQKQNPGVVAVQTQTTGGLLGPVAVTSKGLDISSCHNNYLLWMGVVNCVCQL
jgi:hypothetical protein